MQTEENQKKLDNTIDNEEANIKENNIKVSTKKASPLRKHLAVCLITLTIITLIIGGYCYGTYYYGNHFFPNTVINDLICKNLDYDEAVAALKNQYDSSYCLTLIDKKGREVLVIYPSDIEMKFSLEEGVKYLFQKQDKLRWPMYVLNQKQDNHIVDFNVTYDEQQLRNILHQSDLFKITEEAKPKDAYISEYIEEKNAFEIIKEVEADYLNESVTFIKVREALESMASELDLEAELCYEQPKIYADDKDLVKLLDTMNLYVSSHITYDWNGNTVILQGETIQDWVILSNEGVSLDIEKIAAYIKENAKQYDTYGKKRKFVTTMGFEITLPSGAYGWKTDKEAEAETLVELIMQGSVVEREPVYQSKGWVKGENDIGDSYVEIDLTNQHLYVYENGEIILESDFVSGNMSNSNMTPAGVFGITYKKKNAVLRGEDYEAPVNYWMPFNGNIGMHDATWRRKFGGDIYLTSGSHGCINLPLKNAAKIYEYVSTGFPIVCYY